MGKIVQIRERLMGLQAAGHDVYRLESGDPDFELAPGVLQALQAAAAGGKTHYVPNGGIPELRRAVREKLERQNAIRLEGDQQVLITHGAMHALFVTFQALLMPGDEVIVPDPMWTEVSENIRLARGIPVGVTLRAETGYQYLPAQIEKQLTPRTRAIFLNTPHNPTGAMLSRSVLQELVALARSRDLWLISDEAYEDVVYAPHVHHSIASLAAGYEDRVVSIFSFSKSHAMSGLRVGYLATQNGLLLERMQKIMRCTINGVNSVAQWAALAALKGDERHMQQMRSAYQLRRAVLFETISGFPGVRAFLPQGAFFVWAELDSNLLEALDCSSADVLSNRLAEQGVGAIPGSAFGVAHPNALRFAFSCSTQMVAGGALQLQRLLSTSSRSSVVGQSSRGLCPPEAGVSEGISVS
jgi:aspartate aminotransferase